MSSSKSTLTEILADLKSEYLVALPLKVERMKLLLSESNWNDLTQEFHKLKGTGKTYGFPDISILCEKLELLCSHKETQIPVLFNQAIALIQKMQTAYAHNQTLDLQNEATYKNIMAMKSKISSL